MNATPSPADEILLTLVRHGETAWNMAKRIQGHLDLPLNEVGRLQALACAGCFQPGSVDVLYSSDLLRAMDTATPIAQAAGVAVQPDPVWRERHFGDFQGRRYRDIAGEQPEAYARLKARDPEHAPPGGESLNALMARIAGGLAQIVARHAGQRVVVVSHGGVLDCIYRQATGMPLEAPRSFPIYNAGLNQVRWAKGHWQLVSWGEVGHLADSRDEIDPRPRADRRAGRPD